MVAAIDERPPDAPTPWAASSRCSATGCRQASARYTHWDRRLDSRLAGALMGIQAIKGVELGDGFAVARGPGSAAHDEIEAGPDGLRRTSGHSGRHRGRHVDR